MKVPAQSNELGLLPIQPFYAIITSKTWDLDSPHLLSPGPVTDGVSEPGWETGAPMGKSIQMLSHIKGLVSYWSLCLGLLFLSPHNLGAAIREIEIEVREHFLQHVIVVPSILNISGAFGLTCTSNTILHELCRSYVLFSSGLGKNLEP